MRCSYAVNTADLRSYALHNLVRTHRCPTFVHTARLPPLPLATFVRAAHLPSTSLTCIRTRCKTSLLPTAVLHWYVQLVCRLHFRPAFIRVAQPRQYARLSYIRICSASAAITAGYTNIDSGNGGRRAAYTNVGQRCVPTRFCNTYERRSTMLTADDECKQQQWRQTRSMYECRSAVCTKEVLQRVRTQVDDVNRRRAVRTNLASGNGGRCAACTNVRQPWVPTRFCKVYERRSAVLTAYEQHVRMLESSAYQGGFATCTNAGLRC